MSIQVHFLLRGTDYGLAVVVSVGKTLNAFVRHSQSLRLH